MDAQRAAAQRMTALLRQLRDPETGNDSSSAGGIVVGGGVGVSVVDLDLLSLSTCSPLVLTRPHLFYKHTTTTNNEQL